MSRIIDMHAHIWNGREKDCADAMRKAAGHYGIEKILVSALGSHYPDKDEVRYLNGQTEKLIREDALFGGYVTVSAEHDNALEVLKKGIETQGMIGLKLWVSCLCDEPCCDPLYDYCARNHIPVLIHVFKKTVGQLPCEATGIHMANAARRHPDTRFIMAHLGGNSYHGVRLVKELSNVWVDFSGGNCRGDDVPYAVEQLGAKRILFGTDNAYAMNLGQVMDADLSQQQREQILWKNTAELFGL